jgi:hypothetical protein
VSLSAPHLRRRFCNPRLRTFQLSRKLQQQGFFPITACELHADWHTTLVTIKRYFKSPQQFLAVMRLKVNLKRKFGDFE